MLPVMQFAVTSLLMSGTLWSPMSRTHSKLAAPEGWGGETIELPPGFAPDMKLKGSEHIRFAPGMMKPASDSFFCYAFVFELEPKPVLTEAVVKDEFLKYYRGLCKAVLNGKLPDVDPSEFTLELKRPKSDAKPSSDEKAADTPTLYTGTLDWVEPFATKKPQKLNLEIRTWARNDRNYIFACVSPQARDAAIWKQLHAIRDDYLKKQAEGRIDFPQPISRQVLRVRQLIVVQVHVPLRGAEVRVAEQTPRNVLYAHLPGRQRRAAPPY